MFSLSYRLAPLSHLRIAQHNRYKEIRTRNSFRRLRTNVLYLGRQNIVELLSFYRRNEINVWKSIYRHNDKKVARFVTEGSRKIHRVHVTHRFVSMLVYFCNGKSEKSVVC